MYHRRVQDLPVFGKTVYDTYRQIVDILQVSRKTIVKVTHGNIESLCQSSRHSIWDSYSSEMLAEIRAGKTGKQIHSELACRHNTIGKLTSFYRYIAQLADNAGLQLERYHHRIDPLPDGPTPRKDYDFIKRNGVLQYRWNGIELSQQHLNFLCKKYPIIQILRRRILEFREIFRQKKPLFLFLFIDNYLSGNCEKQSRFASRLQ